MSSTALQQPMPALAWPWRLLPGVALCGAVTLAALALERLEARVLGGTWIEALVLAILVGTAVRTAWTPGRRWFPGIAFSAKTLLAMPGCCCWVPRSARAPSPPPGRGC